MSANFQTNWCSPPGATILDALTARRVELDEFAQQIGYTRQAVEKLISGELQIDRELAIALSDVVGASPKFWLQRQADFDLDKQLVPADVAQRLKCWAQSFPVADMARFGWIPATRSLKEKAINCLQFFGVSSVEQWEDRYSNELKAVAFRSSASLEADIPATLAWLRKGEIEAASIDCASWDKEKFAEALHVIRPLTRQKKPEIFLPQLKKIAADCGVVIVISRTPAGCRASGATKFLDSQKALMMLSFRHRSDDHFWFTFFHEAAHLLLHDKSHLFIENGDNVFEKEEEEANQFAQDFLIPRKYHSEFPKIRRDFRAIVRFAKKIGVSHGIVVGQLQFFGWLDKSRLNRLKHRYDWHDIESAASL